MRVTSSCGRRSSTVHALGRFGICARRHHGSAGGGVSLRPSSLPRATLHCAGEGTSFHPTLQRAHRVSSAPPAWIDMAHHGIVANTRSDRPSVRGESVVEGHGLSATFSLPAARGRSEGCDPSTPGTVVGVRRVRSFHPPACWWGYEGCEASTPRYGAGGTKGAKLPPPGTVLGVRRVRSLRRSLDSTVVRCFDGPCAPWFRRWCAAL